MTTLEVLVKLRAADPWSFTVLDTLVRKGKLLDVVAVTRLKSWRLDFEATAQVALATTRKLLAETALLANPNRDTWLLLGSLGQGAMGTLWKAHGNATEAFAIRVSDHEDLLGRSLAKVLRGRLGLSEVVDVHFASVWLLELRGSGPGARALAEEIAVASSWRKGLLSNPHFQAAEVAKVETYFHGSEVT
ncbi:MAG TPA: hypothetical protein VMU02_04125 [bacterium]|nr:hypothetical protein [bacterium]